MIIEVRNNSCLTQNLTLYMENLSTGDSSNFEWPCNPCILDQHKKFDFKFGKLHVPKTAESEIGL